MKRWAGVGVALLLAGCASAPELFHYRPPAEPGEQSTQVWPEPPETARYAYVGQLLGEQNFRAAAEARSTGERMVRWLVGLGSGDREPTVLRRPSAVTVDADGRVYVTDMAHPSVYVFDPVAPRLSVWERADVGQPFVAPSGVAILPDGELLVADAELGAVFRLDGEGRPLGRFGDTPLLRPGGVAWDPYREEVVVSDIRAHTLEVFDARGHHRRTLGGPGQAPGRFNAPTQVAVAASGYFITDTFNARVQHLSPEGDPRDSIGQRGLLVGDLVRPKGVAVDRHNNLYVVESYYGYLLVYDDQGRFLMPLATEGTALGGLYLPAGVAVDSRQRVYLADMFNGRVLVFKYLDQGMDPDLMGLVRYD
ncbi:6-bladed beta-propeller [Halomonas sp. DQ26W]|uniref:6-bladed beta-propeller n=1 Tax=Halomonas sp. DQ26W TaxID=2282311 RepID=UPI000DF7FBCE|nr:6-bladed beta-propeller [Halomonas sp. DQ26W]RDB42441.1 6-bladed beta-propeller [Halomonas sp. DQ26W]